jgi:hypothetical protein
MLLTLLIGTSAIKIPALPAATSAQSGEYAVTFFFFFFFLNKEEVGGGVINAS